MAQIGSDPDLSGCLRSLAPYLCCPTFHPEAHAVSQITLQSPSPTSKSAALQKKTIEKSTSIPKFNCTDCGVLYKRLDPEFAHRLTIPSKS